MRASHNVLIGLLFALLAAPVYAQPGPGAESQNGYRFGRSNTPGWVLMSKEERTAHRDQMHSFKSVEECKAYLNDHHKLMEARAKEKGKTLPVPRDNACERMKARGMFN